MRRVIIESPYAGDVQRNLRFVRAAMHDALKRGEAPFASHALYTQPGVLDDDDPEERRLGIEAGFAWRRFADATVVYETLGISQGMQHGINHAQRMGLPIETRSIRFDSNPPDTSRHYGPVSTVAEARRVLQGVLGIRLKAVENDALRLLLDATVELEPGTSLLEEQ